MFTTTDLEKLFFSDFKTDFYSYYTETTKDGNLKLVVDVIGHNPKDVMVDVSEDEVVIKAEPKEEAPHFVKSINYRFRLRNEFDGTKSKATIENGILTLVIEKKEDRKYKRLSF